MPTTSAESQKQNEGDGPEHTGPAQTAPDEHLSSTIKAQVIDPATAGAVIAGSALLVTLMQELIAACGGDRAIAIGINNYLTTDLINPEQYIYSGQIVSVAVNIPAGDADASAFQKTAGVGRGTVGVLTYKIEGTANKLAVLWSVPYDQAEYSFWYDVQVIPEKTPTDYNLYNDMYNGNPTKAGTNINKTTKGYQLAATCGTISKCEMNVSIKSA